MQTYHVPDDDSPYPEVRSAVANTDDPRIPASTIRAWVLGLIWAIILPGVNQFFFFRYPAVTISSLVAQLLSFPLGRLWAAVVPRKNVLGLSLNPGPFTVKEHVIITIMAGVGAQSAYATDIIAVQRVYYNQTWGFMYQWLVVMSTQMIGYCIGGIGKRFLVSPPSMIWPANLVLCALFNTLHSQHYSGMGKYGGISRERFFTYAFTAATLYYFLPGYLFQALSYFSWVCWIAPQNVNQMFGYNSGLGFSVLSFDWSQIAYIGSPLATPWWAEVNVIAGFILFYWIITPIVYYSNIWNSQYMPIMSSYPYDNQGRRYNVTRILNTQTTFDINAYRNYSPLFLSTTFAISYGLSFASITATIVHALLYFRKQIWVQARRSLHEQPDIHARLMSKYKEVVPEWWYLMIFLSMFTFGVISIEVWPTQMPVWGLVLALLIAVVYIVPIGMIQAITNQQVGLNVITELVIGFALPGRPIAMMMFKTWGYITMVQALQFTSDFKLGHYMKIPHRPMFWSQVVATAVAGTVQLGVQSWCVFAHVSMCRSGMFTCPNTRVFYTASVIWGVIGPKQQFSPGQTYYGLVYFFLAGAILPFIPWVVLKRWPNGIFRYMNLPIFLNGTGLIPPATAQNFVPWAVIGFIFQYVIRRRHFSWWSKYNYVLSAALDSGVAIGVLIVYFALEFPRNGTIGQQTIGKWWGNSVHKKTADWVALPLKQVPPGNIFGSVTIPGFTKAEN
ncbi:small oligopeptide transporter [Rickenella mellea]|uniref:Small oligopeptide transporter n=1 Tax=Rickenella mellea TaxID=50990 RepID=A0A4Y7Q406_9AGAM|nr:small oligopeptide transporter [Rickenella mellea]